MGSDDRVWVWWVKCREGVPKPFRDLNAQEVPPGSSVFAVRASRAVMDTELPPLLAAGTVTGATCLGPPSQPPTQPWKESGALVVDRRLAQRIWTAADILGGAWTMKRASVPGSPDTYFEDPVTTHWDDPDQVELTLEPRKVYGSRAVDSWFSWSSGPPYPKLDKTKERPDPDFNDSPARVRSYTELVDRVAFLAVMNKTLIPLLRGQTDGKWPVQATIYRRDFTVKAHGTDWKMAPGSSVEHYLEQLASIEQVVYDVLEGLGLPRTAHLDPLRGRRAAIWAVIQHYELWPTPLVDFTTSVRVAATFAFGFDPESKGFKRAAEEGFVYVYGVPTLTSDLMQPRGSSLAVRLNSVCPPGARRPHLQDGILVGRDNPTLVTEDRSVAAIPLAKLHLDNSGGGFWDNEDFPPLSQGSLLPDPDELRDELRQSLQYDHDEKGRCIVSGRG